MSTGPAFWFAMAMCVVYNIAIPRSKTLLGSVLSIVGGGMVAMTSYAAACMVMGVPG